MAKHSLEFNKVAGGFLLAGVLAMTSSFIADGLYTPKHAEKRGYSVDVPEETAGGGAAAVVEADIGTLLANADASRGEAAAMKKCTACHTFEQGGANKVGPNLFNTVGNKVGHIGGFAYSEALKSHGGSWGYDELNHWLKAPASFAKGNKMAFAGLKKDEERADVIMYLKSISSGAPALPTPKPASVDEAVDKTVDAKAEAGKADAPAKK